jgi:4-amino-4-deoxy-L-arabinose transferase-like glycosyltransferase
MKIRKLTKKAIPFIPVIIFFLAFFSILFHSGTSGLFETSEGRYASVGRAMLDSGDWLIPQNNGLKHFTKPPVTYWLSALGMKLFGINEFGARFFLSLAAGFTALGCYLIGNLLFSQLVGLISALILSTSLFFLIQFKGLTTDPFLTAFETFMVFGFLSFLKKKKAIWIYFFWIFAGLAMLTKGPPGLLPLLGLIPACLLKGYKEELKKIFYHFKGLGLFFVIGFGWFFLVAFKTPGLLSYFLIDETIKRVASSSHSRTGPFYMFILLLPAGLFPWTGYLFSGIKENYKRLKDKNELSGFLLFWLVIPLIVFSISKSKLAAYVLPLLIPVALIAGVRFKDFLSTKKEDLNSWFSILIPTNIFIGLFGIGAIAWATLAKVPAENLAKSAIFLGMYWLLSAICLALFIKFKNKVGVIAVLGLIAPGFIFFTLPGIKGYEEFKKGKFLPSPKITLKRLSSVLPSKKLMKSNISSTNKPNVITIEEMIEGTYFYTGQNIPTWNVTRITAFDKEKANKLALYGPEALKENVARSTLLLIRNKDIQKVESILNRNLEILSTSGKWNIAKTLRKVGPN